MTSSRSAPAPASAAAVMRDLEADRLESSGGAVYARGHVKSHRGARGRRRRRRILDAFDPPASARAPVPTLRSRRPHRGAAAERRTTDGVRRTLRGPTGPWPRWLRRWPWSSGCSSSACWPSALGGDGRPRRAHPAGAREPQRPARCRPPAPRPQPPRRRPRGGAARAAHGGSSWVSVRNSGAHAVRGRPATPAGRKGFRDPKQLRPSSATPARSTWSAPARPRPRRAARARSAVTCSSAASSRD